MPANHKIPFLSSSISLITRAMILKRFMLLVAISSPVGAAVNIENEMYSVSADAGGGSFSVIYKPTGKAFLSAGKLSGTEGKAKVVDVSDNVFGQGRCIEISYANGNRETIALYHGLPLVLCGGSLHNGGPEPVVLNHVPTVTARVDLGKPISAIRTLGTGGLLEPAKNPGSYAFLAIVDPESRSGVVGGWITHERGSGVVFSQVDGDEVRMQAKLEYGRLRIRPGQDAALETFAIGYFDDARFGLEAYADAIAKLYLVRLPPLYSGHCTWYMEKNSKACDEKNLVKLSEYAAKNLKPFGFDFIQIDDGWQDGVKINGPKKNFTTHASNGPYAGGMKQTADNIEKLGLTPGIWFMPFAGTSTDPYFKDHQDWFAKKTTDGKPYETAWGGTCLDTTHPGAQEHIKGVVNQIAHEWGYKVFKMDGFWTGSATKQMYVNNGYKEDGMGDAEFFNPDKTNIEALRDGTKMVRAAAGPNVFLLGCCVSQNMRSFGGTFGLLDAMRVGPDTGSGDIGAPDASRMWFLNGRVWWNDPDCVSVRASVPLERARLNATFTTMAGDLFYNSDWMPDFPAERLDILRRCIPSHNLFSRPVDVFESQPARIWHLADTRGAVRRDIVALYNWGKEPATVECAVGRIGLPVAKEYVAFDFWANRFVPPFKDTVRANLPAGGSCRVLAVKPVSENPQLLSTSRHMTQGIIDVSDEKWDASLMTLSAVSKVVGADPYELRIVVPVGDKSWKVNGVSISADDVAAGVKVEFKQEGPKVRVLISSAANREVKWWVQFKSGKVDAAVVQPAAKLKAEVEYCQILLNWEENGADSYRVTRDDGVFWMIPSGQFVDVSFSRGKPLTYTVEAMGWDGKASKPMQLEVTPMADMKVPPKPPAPTVYLDEVKCQVVENGWGKVDFGKSISDKPLSVAGRKYRKGFGVHAKSLVVCPVPSGAARFVAVAGLDDSQRKDERASVTFEVYGDVKEMGEQAVLLGQSPVLSAKTIRDWAFNVELNTRFKELRLVVTDAGDGNSADHADWVDAGFIVPAGK